MVVCSFVLKPPSTLPIRAFITGKFLAVTEIPNGAFSIAPGLQESARRLTTDSRLKRLNLTESSTSRLGPQKLEPIKIGDV